MSADAYLNFMKDTTRNRRQYAGHRLSTVGRAFQTEKQYLRRAAFDARNTRVHLGSLSGLSDNGLGEHLEAKGRRSND